MSDKFLGLKWFKIFHEGLSNSQWGSDLVYINKGNVTFTIPSCIASGNYLLRVEDIGIDSLFDPLLLQSSDCSRSLNFSSPSRNHIPRCTSLRTS